MSAPCPRLARNALRLTHRLLGRSAGVALLVSVAAAIAVADDRQLPIRGVVKAVDQAALSTDLPMRIVRLPFREGQRFMAGDVLVAFDCRRQEAELQAMRGALREAELNLASSLSLDKFKAIGRNDVEIARARLDKAKGELRSLAVRVEDCEVQAPFPGRVSDAPLRVLEFTTPQRPYLTIVGSRDIEIEMIVPSSMVASLEAGRRLRFSVDELAGAEVPAVVSEVGAVVDPVSKTLKIVARPATPAPELIAGMSGTAFLGSVEAQAR